MIICHAHDHLSHLFVSFLACKAVHVGGSHNKKSKTITVPSGFVCPLKVDNKNWLRKLEPTPHTDKFAIKQTGTQVVVTRTNGNGWGVNLGFECCTRPKSPIGVGVSLGWQDTCTCCEPSQLPAVLKQKAGKTWLEVIEPNMIPCRTNLHPACKVKFSAQFDIKYMGLMQDPYPRQRWNRVRLESEDGSTEVQLESEGDVLYRYGLYKYEVKTSRVRFVPLGIAAQAWARWDSISGRPRATELEFWTSATSQHIKTCAENPLLKMGDQNSNGNRSVCADWNNFIIHRKSFEYMDKGADLGGIIPIKFNNGDSSTVVSVGGGGGFLAMKVSRVSVAGDQTSMCNAVAQGIPWPSWYLPCDSKLGQSCAKVALNPARPACTGVARPSACTGVARPSVRCLVDEEHTFKGCYGRGKKDATKQCLTRACVMVKWTSCSNVGTQLGAKQCWVKKKCYVQDMDHVKCNTDQKQQMGCTDEANKACMQERCMQQCALS